MTSKIISVFHFCASIFADDNLVLNSRYYSSYAAAANCQPDNITSWKCTPYCTATQCDIVKTQVFIDTRFDTLVYLKPDHNTRATLVSFRASKNILNWITNLRFAQGSYYEKQTGVKSKIHKGFYTAHDSLSKLYFDNLKSLVSMYPSYKLVFVGHSLGGTLATISSLDVKFKLGIEWSNIEVYTYGGPRIMNKELALYLNSQKFVYARFVYKEDMVPHLPPLAFGYSHTGVEIWRNKKDVKICYGLEDAGCSNSVKKMNIDDHFFSLGEKFGIKC